jgi:hypothetical protein
MLKRTFKLWDKYRIKTIKEKYHPLFHAKFWLRGQQRGIISSNCLVCMMLKVMLIPNYDEFKQKKLKKDQQGTYSSFNDIF